MKIKITLLLLFFAKIGISQDIHFSQNFVDRMYLSPSLIGQMENSDYRVSVIRRSQWQSVSVPFSTFSASIENKNIYNNFNVGIQFFNDQAGDSRITLNQLNLAVSKDIKIFEVNTFAIGAIIGVGQKKIDNSVLFFEENEDLLNSSFMFSDIGIGASYIQNLNEVFSYHISISSYHLNNPNQSFNEDKSVSLKYKNNLLIGFKYVKYRNLKIKSSVMYTKQGSSEEILIGFIPEIELDKINIRPLLFYRMKDAIIIGCGFGIKNTELNISYDINTSDLIPASQKRGGFEFSIVYFWKHKKKDKEKTKPKDEICPKYL